MKKLVIALSLLIVLAGQSFSQIRKSIEHPTYSYSWSEIILCSDGYYVLGLRQGAGQIVVSRFLNDGSLVWFNEYYHTPTLSTWIVSGAIDAEVLEDDGLMIVADNDNFNVELLKIKPDGSIDFAKTIDKAEFSMYTKSRLKRDANGNIYILLSCFDYVDIIKLDSVGNPLWENKYTIIDTTNKNPSFDLQIASNNELICSSKSESDPSFLRINTSTGNPVWVRTFRDNGQAYTQPLRIIELQNGNLFSAGYRVSTTGNMDEGIFAMIMDPNGNILHYKFIYSANVPSVTNIFEGSGGALYLMGEMANNSLLIELDDQLNIVSEKGLADYYTYEKDFDMMGSEMFFLGTYNFNQYHAIYRLKVNDWNYCNIISGIVLTSEDISIGPSQISADVQVQNLTSVISSSVYTINPVTGYTISYGCGSQALEGAVSISDPVQVNIELYPNPTTGNLVISSDIRDLQQFEVRDILGRVLRKGALTYTGNEYFLEVNDLETGVYTLIVSAKNGSSLPAVKFLKQ